ncbi:hypothetical protein V1478_001769 [Vespula squamosa]|uniref:Uncharacterized protein n=1 Tax=Vespula squamosa TaxID=30214 RepID=A0ABD2BY28_VESSQ
MDRRNAYRSIVIALPLAITSNRDIQIGLRVPSNMWHSDLISSIKGWAVTVVVVVAVRGCSGDSRGGRSGREWEGVRVRSFVLGIFTFWMNIRDTPLRDVLSSSHVVRGDASLKMRFHVVGTRVTAC